MRPPSFLFLPLLVGGLVLLGPVGCAGPQPTHHSGQIGRFYGEGVSFSVPQVSRADKPGGEDRYWELRRGIDKAIVVAFKPLPAGNGGFRENLVLTAQNLDGQVDPAQFRAQQMVDLRAAGKLVGEPDLGQDRSGPWLGFSGQEEGRPVVCRAWFFVIPGQGQVKPRGFVLMGTAQTGPATAATMEEFARVAATFRIGRPPTGFFLLGQAVDEAVAAVASGRADSPAAPMSPEAPGAAAPAGRAVPTPAPTAPPAPGGLSPAPVAPDQPSAPSPAPPPPGPVTSPAPQAP